MTTVQETVNKVMAKLKSGDPPPPFLRGKKYTKPALTCTRQIGMFTVSMRTTATSNKPGSASIKVYIGDCSIGRYSLQNVDRYTADANYESMKALVGQLNTLLRKGVDNEQDESASADS